MSLRSTLISIRRLLRQAGDRARAPCPDSKGASSTTPKDRWFRIITEETREGKHNEEVLSEINTLLASVAEKRRLTIDWRGGMMTNAQLIKATAKRVGLAPPELVSDKTAAPPKRT